jgi:hypothetical protein
MKKISYLLMGIILGFCAFGCSGGGKELYTKPKLEVLLDQYEAIIDRHAPGLERAKKNPDDFKRRIEAFASEVSRWSEQWESISGTIDPKELKKAQARLNRLNQRVFILYTAVKNEN